MVTKALEALHGRISRVGYEVMRLWEKEAQLHLVSANRRRIGLRAILNKYGRIAANFGAETTVKEYVEGRIEALRNGLEPPPGWTAASTPPQWGLAFVPLGWLAVPKARPYRSKLAYLPYVWNGTVYAADGVSFLTVRQSASQPPSDARFIDYLGDFLQYAESDLRGIMSAPNIGPGLLTYLEQVLASHGLRRGLPFPTFERDLKQFYATHRMYNATVERLLGGVAPPTCESESLGRNIAKQGIITVEELVRRPDARWVASRRAAPSLEETVRTHGLAFDFPYWRL